MNGLEQRIPRLAEAKVLEALLHPALARGEEHAAAA